jgi:hypothetical protein
VDNFEKEKKKKKKRKKRNIHTNSLSFYEMAREACPADSLRHKQRLEGTTFVKRYFRRRMKRVYCCCKSVDINIIESSSFEVEHEGMGIRKE